MKLNKWEVLQLISFFILIFGACFLTYYVTVEKIHSCTSDPLGYSVDYFKEHYEVTSVTGTITLYGENGAKQIESFGDTIDYLGHLMPS